MSSIICPISKEKVDNNQSRITVFLSVIFMLAFIYTRQPIYMVFATVDTSIRAIFHGKYSPFKMIGASILRVFKLEGKKIDQAKKVFASRLGMLCGMISIVMFYLGLESGSFIIAGFWMFLALLDSIFNFCLGCITYTYIVLPFFRRK